MSCSRHPYATSSIAAKCRGASDRCWLSCIRPNCLTSFCCTGVTARVVSSGTTHTQAQWDCTRTVRCTCKHRTQVASISRCIPDMFFMFGLWDMCAYIYILTCAAKCCSSRTFSSGGCKVMTICIQSSVATDCRLKVRSGASRFSFDRARSLVKCLP